MTTAEIINNELDSLILLMIYQRLQTMRQQLLLETTQEQPEPNNEETEKEI